MRRSTTLASIFVGAAALIMAPMSHAAVKPEVKANIANGKKIFTEGKGSVPACNSCHGADGMGDDNLGTPRLAGQISQFIVKQLEDFATDRRQDTTMFVMNTNAKGLSAQDRRDVAAYVSTLKNYKIRTVLGQQQLVEAKAGSNLKELAANGTEIGKRHLGKAIVNYGAPERGIPACRSCHGYNGRGVDPIYPKIGGQRFTYIVNQLKNFREGKRKNDPMSQMQVVARKLSDEDILNLATFLTNAPPTSLGNIRLPEQHPFMAFDTH
ncbi:MAG TPA: c-type cytochrome [Gammaproteobacteria bacterium]|nr:c-type cytochrome [Gammaproteobacteria bacterium]